MHLLHTCAVTVDTLAKFAARLGCLTSIIAPLMALLLYPRANWLFALALIGVMVLALRYRDAQDPTPQALADDIERILEGACRGWDIDDFESLCIREPQLKEFWSTAMSIGRPPEEWSQLNAEAKDQLREIICQLRGFGQARADVPQDFLADRSDEPPQKRDLF